GATCSIAPGASRPALDRRGGSRRVDRPHTSEPTVELSNPGRGTSAASARSRSLRMIGFPSTRGIAMHEGGHAASLCLGGMPPLWTRIDWPGERQLGSTKPDWEGHGCDDHAMREVLIATLLAPMLEPPDVIRRAFRGDVFGGRATRH